VDVGGTTTAAGLVTATGRVLAEAQAPTHREGSASAGRTLTALVETMTARARAERRRVIGIGLGLPGIVDARGRIGDEAHHVPDLVGRPLAAQLRRRFDVPVFIDNDVNALALGEWMFGRGRRARSLVLLAPGTGFGAGIVLDGVLVRGASGFGGELGHAPVKFDGPPCWCGGRGCLALYASGRGIADTARARATGHDGAALRDALGGNVAAITAPRVFAAAAAGEPQARVIVDEACQALGAMIGIVVNGLNPEEVVVTGGVAAAFATLEREVLRAAAAYAFARALVRTRVRFVPGDKRHSMRGAAALVLYEMGRRGGTGGYSRRYRRMTGGDRWPRR
jgi:glucokinase